MVFPEEVGLGWVGARGADVRCDQYIKTWLIRRPWGLHYSTACTWEFNIRFMSLGNKNSTGKAVFQTLSIFWVENRSELTTSSSSSPHTIHPEEPTLPRLRPSQAWWACWETEWRTSLGDTHTQRAFYLSLISFPLDSEVVPPSGSSRASEVWTAFTDACSKASEPIPCCPLTQQRTQGSSWMEIQKPIFKGQCFASKWNVNLLLGDILHLLCTGGSWLQNYYFSICVLGHVTYQQIYFEFVQCNEWPRGEWYWGFSRLRGKKLFSVSLKTQCSVGRRLRAEEQKGSGGRVMGERGSTHITSPRFVLSLVKKCTSTWRRKLSISFKDKELAAQRWN